MAYVFDTPAVMLLMLAPKVAIWLVRKLIGGRSEFVIDIMFELIPTSILVTPPSKLVVVSPSVVRFEKPAFIPTCTPATFELRFAILLLRPKLLASMLDCVAETIPCMITAVFWSAARYNWNVRP